MNETNYAVPFDSLCRTCLDSKENMKSIQDPSIVNMLKICVNIQVLQEDGFPNLICLKCLHQIYTFFDFKQLCDKSDAILKQFSSECFLPIEFQGLRKNENIDQDYDKCDKQKSLHSTNPLLSASTNKINHHQSEDEDTTGFVDCPELDLEPECNLVENALAALQDLEKKNVHKIETNFTFETSSTNLIRIKTNDPLNSKTNEYINILNKKFSCMQCTENFVNANDLAVHLSIHSTDGTMTCNICNKTFIRMKMLKRHIKTHMISKAYRCHICSKEFTESGTLNKHIKRHSGITRDKKYFCSTCGKGYQDQTYLIIHNRKHTGERPFSCKQCSKSFAEERLLISHAKTHSQDKSHECIVCSKRFAHSSTLTTHLRTHTGEKPYACKICNKRFIQSSNLSLHMRTHTGVKPYKCDICNKNFASSSTLTYHLRTHTGEKPYLCSVCGKSFARSEDVTLHMRTHTGERPYECTVCQKRFTTSSHRNQHALIHASEKPYVCKLCKNWSCVSLANMKKHNLEVHSNTPNSDCEDEIFNPLSSDYVQNGTIECTKI